LRVSVGTRYVSLHGNCPDVWRGNIDDEQTHIIDLY